MSVPPAVPLKISLLAHGARSWLARLRRPLAIPSKAISALRGGRAGRLLVAPQDIRAADPIVADHIYAGRFSLAGKMAHTHGHSPFVIAAPSPAWSEALHGFGWLRHLRAADTSLSRANARALVEDWLDLYAHGGRSTDRRARDPHVAARRLISWLSQSPMLLADAGQAFCRRFLGAVEAHGARLERAIAEGLDGEARLTALIALTQTGLCLEGAGGLLKRASLQLSRELPAQILRDGGHVGRNPRVLLELLLDLLPTRQAFVARSVAAPEALLNAVDRMTPMLRMFRHADGSLAGFNGMSATETDTLALLLAHGDFGGAPVLDARYSGYQRLDAQGATLIADVGRPPPRRVFARGARRLSVLRIFGRTRPARRQLRRAAARRERGARGRARQRRPFDAGRRRSFELPVRARRRALDRRGHDFGGADRGRGRTAARRRRPDHRGGAQRLCAPLRRPPSPHSASRRRRRAPDRRGSNRSGRRRRLIGEMARRALPSSPFGAREARG